MKIHEIIAASPEYVKAPHYVVCTFGQQASKILFSGKEVSLAEDFKSLEMQREAIAWYVDQLGGKVKWGK